MTIASQMVAIEKLLTTNASPILLSKRAVEIKVATTYALDYIFFIRKPRYSYYVKAKLAPKASTAQIIPNRKTLKPIFR
jgi:hypothetical protein